MLEQIITQCFYQIVTRFKMRIKSAAPDVGFFNYFLHGYFIITFYCQKLSKGFKNCRACFLLTPVHYLTPHKFKKMYINAHLHRFVYCPEALLLTIIITDEPFFIIHFVC